MHKAARLTSAAIFTARHHSCCMPVNVPTKPAATRHCHAVLAVHQHLGSAFPMNCRQAVLRLVAWLGLAAKAAAAGRAGSWLATLMAVLGSVHSLAPVALLVWRPDIFFR